MNKIIKNSILLTTSIFYFSTYSICLAMDDTDYNNAKIAIKAYVEQNKKMSREYNPLDEIQLIRAVKVDNNGKELDYTSLAWCLKSETEGVYTFIETPPQKARRQNVHIDKPKH